MAEIDPLSMAEAIQEWSNTPHGHRGRVVEKLCSALNISRGVFHKARKRVTGENLRRQRCDSGKRNHPQIEPWAEIVVKTMAFVPKTTRRPTIKLALRKALINGLLPPEAKEIGYEAFCRVIREKGFLEREKKITRFEARSPMECWQMDASGSEYIYVARFENGTPILKLRATKTGYKNKPNDGMRVWYYGMVDDHSGYWLARANIAAGESSADNLNFFKFCACPKGNQAIPFYGLPEMVYMDNGPLARAATTKEFFKRIDVELKTHEPNSPEDTGKIEIRWRQLWRLFEMDMLMDPHWEKLEFTADELNQCLMNFCIEQNMNQHRHLKCSRLDAWMAVIKNGGVVEIGEEAWDTVFKTKKVLVDNAGWFEFEGIKYEVKGILDKWVRAYRGVLNGQVLVKDLQTNFIYEAKEARYLGIGEHRADKKQEWERLKKESQIMKELFAPGTFKRVYGNESETLRQAQGDNLTYFPVRATERTVETSFERVDPFAKEDYEKLIPVESDAFKVDRGIAPSRMSIMEFFRRLVQEVGPITPELNQQLRAEYGDSIEIKKAEEVINELRMTNDEGRMTKEREAAAG